jgi:hypothetical protein
MDCHNLEERPRCRKKIIELSLRPYHRDGRWDGFSAVDRDGKRSYLGGRMKTQMRKMLEEGFWKGLQE